MHGSRSIRPIRRRSCCAATSFIRCIASARPKSIARRLVTLREFVLDYGLLGDVLMEQGRLDEAATAYQRMIDLKPFYQSYTARLTCDG